MLVTNLRQSDAESVANHGPRQNRCEERLFGRMQRFVADADRPVNASGVFSGDQEFLRQKSRRADQGLARQELSRVGLNAGD